MKTLLVATLAAAFCAVFAANAVAAAPPSNDNRLAARSVSVPQTVSGTTAGATLEDGEVDSQCSYGSKNSVWYALQGTGQRIAVGLDAGGDLDAVLDVDSFARSQPTTIGCESTDSKGLAVVDFKSTKGATYFVRVAERQNSVSDGFSLRFLTTAAAAHKPGKPLPSNGVSSSVDLASNPSDAWSVKLHAGTTYRMNLVATSNTCVSGDLYAPGESIGDNGSGSFSCSNGFRLFTPTRGGHYTILVQSPRGTLDTARYHLEVGPARRDDTQPGLDWHGGPRHGTLDGRGLDAQDLYNFVLRRTAYVSLRVKTSHDFDVELLSAGGSYLGCSCNGEINRKLKPGNYFARVFANQAARGAYTLKRTVRKITHTTLLFDRSRQALAHEGSTVHLTANVLPHGGGKLRVTVLRKDPVFGWQFYRKYVGSGGRGMDIAFRPPGVGEYKATAQFSGSKTANHSSSKTARLSVRR